MDRRSQLHDFMSIIYVVKYIIQKKNIYLCIIFVLLHENKWNIILWENLKI